MRAVLWVGLVVVSALLKLDFRSPNGRRRATVVVVVVPVGNA